MTSAGLRKRLRFLTWLVFKTESGIKKLIVTCLRHFPGGFGLVSTCGNNKKSVASRNNMYLTVYKLSKSIK